MVWPKIERFPDSVLFRVFSILRVFRKMERKAGTMDLDLLKRRELLVGSYLEILVEVLKVMILAIPINSGRST